MSLTKNNVDVFLRIAPAVTMFSYSGNLTGIVITTAHYRAYLKHPTATTSSWMESCTKLILGPLLFLADLFPGKHNPHLLRVMIQTQILKVKEFTTKQLNLQTAQCQYRSKKLKK